MTSRQAATHILDGILKLVYEKQKAVIELRNSGHYDDAAVEEISADALSDVASGLSSAIDDGEYGE